MLIYLTLFVAATALISWFALALIRNALPNEAKELLVTHRVRGILIALFFVVGILVASESLSMSEFLTTFVGTSTVCTIYVFVAMLPTALILRKYRFASIATLVLASFLVAAVLAALAIPFSAFESSVAVTRWERLLPWLAKYVVPLAVVIGFVLRLPWLVPGSVAE
jgi:hypothetical protein